MRCTCGCVGGHEDAFPSLESHDCLLLEVVELEGILHRHAWPQILELRIRQYLMAVREGKKEGRGASK